MEGHRWGPVPQYSQWWSDAEGLGRRERDPLFLPWHQRELRLASFMLESTESEGRREKCQGRRIGQG